MRTLEKIVCACTLAAAALFGGCTNDDGDDDPIPDPPPTYTWEETQLNPLMHEGVVLTSWWFNDYYSPVTDVTLEYLHDLGVESVAILATQYQNDALSTDIQPDVLKTPADWAIASAVQKAKSLGMRTVLKPHVDLYDGNWRGNIDFGLADAAWADWFASYRNLMMQYAGLAEQEGIDMLVIGTELKGTTKRAAEWNQLIDDVAAVFSGEITYGANYDNYQNITWWNNPNLDYIGVNAYFPLTATYDPTYSELLSAWAPIADEMRTFSQTVGKDIMITEIGYQSYDGTNTYPPWAPTLAHDGLEQADCIGAAFSTFHNQDFIGGMYIWKTYYNPWNDLDGFDFIGKPAEVEVNTTYHLTD
jgi:hypothetical protein